MTRVIKIIALVGGVAALGLLVASASLASTHAKKAAHYKSPQFTLHATLVIRADTEQGKKGPDGKWHDAYLPANFTVLKGVRVKVTVFNYDDMPHTFTSPSLHVNKTIRKGSEAKPSKTTFTFLAKKSGKYLWWCSLPCDPYSMSHIGYMRGYVTVAA